MDTPRRFRADADAWADGSHKTDIYKQLADLKTRATPQQITGFIAQQLKTVPDPDSLRAIMVFLSENTYGMTDPQKLNIDYYLLYSDSSSLLASMDTNKGDLANDLKNALKALQTFELLAMSRQRALRRQVGLGPVQGQAHHAKARHPAPRLPDHEAR